MKKEEKLKALQICERCKGTGWVLAAISDGRTDEARISCPICFGNGAIVVEYKR